MPCQTYTDSELRQMETNRHREEVAKMAEEINKLTRLLCFACGVINLEKRKMPMPDKRAKELRNWYAEHKKHDTLRLQQVFDGIDEEDRQALRAAIMSGDVK